MVIKTAGALPGGNRNNNGSFNNLGNNANFWSSTENSSSNAWNRNLNYNNADVNRNNNNKENGFSLRCTKDWKTKPAIILQALLCKYISTSTPFQYQ